IVAVERVRISSLRLDNYWPINAGLFLERRMAVIPVGAALMDREPVDECLAWRNARKAQAGHAVHRGWSANAVPMDRSRIGEPVRDGRGDCVTLPPSKRRRGYLAVDRGRGSCSTGDVHRHRPDL